MLVLMSRKWWALALRGVVGVLFGLAAFVWPGITLLALVTLFGIYALVDGILALVTALTRDTGRRTFWSLLIEGLVGIAIGLVTFIRPGITAFGLLYLIAFWALVTGIFEIITAIRLRREIAGEWLLALTGIWSVAFALLLIIYPLAGAMAALWIIGSYAIVFGALMIVLAFRLRHLHDSGGHLHQTPSPVH